MRIYVLYIYSRIFMKQFIKYVFGCMCHEATTRHILITIVLKAEVLVDNRSITVKRVCSRLIRCLFISLSRR